MKKTKWFPCTVKPVHTGVYEVILISSYGSFLVKGYSKWNGSWWADTSVTIELANRQTSKGLQTKQWRGLAKKP
jgi:hypothetical protein